MDPEGTINEAFDAIPDDAVEEDELCELQSLDFKSNRKKVVRHNTETFTSQRKRVDNDVITEEVRTTGPLTTKQKPQKKTVLVTRHNTEVLRKRPPSTTLLTPSRELDEVQVTRRSVSRQGSRIQTASKMQIIDDEDASAKSILKSSAIDKSTRKKTKLLTREAYRQLHQQEDYVRQNQIDINTDALKTSLGIVQKHKVLFITGKRGIGKTFTALNVVNALLNTHKDHTPLIIKYPYQIAYLIDNSEPLVVLADDFCGQNTLSYAWKHMFKKLKRSFKTQRIFLIFTSENDSNEEQELIANIMNGEIVMVNMDDYTRSLEERTEYIKNYFYARDLNISGLEIESMAEVEQESIDIGFPLVCHLASSGDYVTTFHEPFQQLCKKISQMRLQNIQQYVVLIVTLVFGNCFPKPSKLTTKQKVLYQKIIKLLSVENCFYTNLSSVSQELETMNILCRTCNGSHSYQFAHSVYQTAVCHDFIKQHSLAAFTLLPVEVISPELLKFANNNDTTDTDNNEMCSHDDSFANCSKQLFKFIVERFNEELVLKQQSEFITIASSQLWKSSSFTGIAFAIVGSQILFTEDETNTPLTVYMIRSGNTEVVSKLVDFISKYRSDDMAKYHTQILKITEEVCRQEELDVLPELVNVLSTIDESIINAAASSTNIDTMRLLVNHGGQIFQRRSEALQTACVHSNVEMVNFIFDHLDEDTKYALTHNMDTRGQTIVHFAAMAVDPNILKSVVEQGADPLIQTNEGISILHIASQYGRLEMVKFICETLPNLILMTDNNGFTSAHFAAREGFLKVLQYLITKTVNPTLKVFRGNTILHLAAYNGRNDVLRYLCKAYTDILPLQNNDSFTAAQIAATAGHSKSLQFFIDIGEHQLTKTVDGRSFLHIAAFNGKLELVRYLCEHYPELHKECDHDGNSAAHDAAASGKVHVLEYLIKNYIDPLVASSDGCTLLHDACYYGRPDMVNFLSTKHPKLVNISTANGYSPCHGAALGGYVNILEILINKGADPYTLSEDGSTILHEAAFSGKTEMVKYIYSKWPDMLHITNDRSYVPLHFAAQEGHSDVLSYILSQSKNESEGTSEGQTILHISAYNCRMMVVKFLCREFPNLINIVDEHGASAIHYAARGGHVDLLTYLMGHTPDPCITTGSGSTMLHLAAYDGKYDMVVYLCKKFPHLIPALDKSKHSAIHYAAGSGHIELLKFLLTLGIDPLLRTDNGSNLLVKAAYNGKLEMVKFLSTEYPDMIPITDDFGCNAAHYAACGGHIDILKYTVGLSIDPMTVTKDGHTLLHIASYHGQLALVNFLCQSYPDMRTAVDHSGHTAAEFANMGGQHGVEKFLNRDVVVADDYDSSDHDCILWLHLRQCKCCRNCKRANVVACLRRTWRAITSAVCICRRGQ